MTRKQAPSDVIGLNSFKFRGRKDLMNKSFLKQKTMLILSK